MFSKSISNSRNQIRENTKVKFTENNIEYVGTATLKEFISDTSVDTREHGIYFTIANITPEHKDCVKNITVLTKTK